MRQASARDQAAPRRQNAPSVSCAGASSVSGASAALGVKVHGIFRQLQDRLTFLGAVAQSLATSLAGEPMTAVAKPSVHYRPRCQTVPYASG